jgi:hypothetical protein
MLGMAPIGALATASPPTGLMAPTPPFSGHPLPTDFIVNIGRMMGRRS